MSLLQEILIKNLPKNNYNVSKTALEVGYSPTTARSGVLYAGLRRHPKYLALFTEDVVKTDILRVKKLALKEKDLSNFLRATELQSKILGMQVDKSEITNKNPEKIVVAYGAPQNIVNITTQDVDIKPQVSPPPDGEQGQKAELT